jgi:rubrerythrin
LKGAQLDPAMNFLMGRNNATKNTTNPTRKTAESKVLPALLMVINAAGYFSRKSDTFTFSGSLSIVPIYMHRSQGGNDGMAPLNEEILGRAIRIEIKARDFYSRLAGQIRNRRGRRKMQTLSRNEEHHKKMLQRRFRSLLGREYNPTTNQDTAADEGGENPTSLGEHVFTDQASAIQVVSFAIGMEDRAARYYTEQFEKVDNPKDVRLLKRLVRFETQHKTKLQAEYLLLNSSFYWISEI